MSTAAAPALGRAPAPGRASTLTGAGELARFSMHRDRILIPAWMYLFLIIAVSGGFALKDLYKTPAARASLAATEYHDAALSFIYGQLHGDSLGALASWRYLVYAGVGAGLMSIFLVVRHTRADEETGRLELIGSTVVGRHAPMAVALQVALTANFVGFVLTAAVLTAAGLPFAGSVAYALAEVSVGLVFAAVAVITAQVSGTARGARGIAIATLCVVFFFRAVGDSGGSHHLTWLTWLSPIGWAELVRPFTGDRWLVLLLPLAVTVVGVAVAFLLAGRRDHGAGLVQPGPGPAQAGPLLAGPFGLAWRLERATLSGWLAGFLAGGLAIGVVGQGIGKLLGSSSVIEKALDKIGGQSALASAYLASCMSLLALVAAAYSVAAVLRMRSEESDGRTEPMLATPLGRIRWAGSYLLMATAGTLAVLVVGALGMGLGYGLAVSDLSTWLPRMIGAGLAQVPAALAVAGVAVLFIGLAPRWSLPAGWTAVAICGLIGVFGPAFNLSQAVLDISPFTAVPRLPGGAFSAVPLVWLMAAALIMAGAGLAGLRRRDIG